MNYCFQAQKSSSPEEAWLINLLLWRRRGLLLLFPVTRVRSRVQTRIPLARDASLRMVVDAAQKCLGGRGSGSVVIVGDGDLLILLSLQLALIEAERPFKNVFDLADKHKGQKNNLETHRNDNACKIRADRPVWVQPVTPAPRPPSLCAPAGSLPGYYLCSKKRPLMKRIKVFPRVNVNFWSACSISKHCE